MGDPREIDALKASFRGVLTSAASLDRYGERVMGWSAGADPAPAELEELLKAVAAHATASAALRGLLVRMMEKRVVEKEEGTS